MRRLLRFLLYKPIAWATGKFASRPRRDRIFPALDKLYADILENSGRKGPFISFDATTGRYIIFSDQHKGARNGADDFMPAEPNYLAALDFYYHQGFSFISLGDSEELWENTLGSVKKHNKHAFAAEQKFVTDERLIKIIGNHDLYWGNDPFAWWQLKNIYKKEIKAFEGAVLEMKTGNDVLHIFCTHGHQGDASSDGNWFSKFFVARIWAPLQAYLRINPNTAAYDGEKKTLHNEIMYEWASQKENIILVTGHTHQPVFASLTHLERLYKELQKAMADNQQETVAELRAEIRKREKEFSAVAVDYLLMRPVYFNSGCCCFTDGDITGLELADGCIRLVKWHLSDNAPVRTVLEERTWKDITGKL
ncbi:MAG TPA: metallophosphoesterase [Chitinophagaceae bacterium]|nr:metallophosphoesterase [Chitinophagaceae bacterium]